MRPRTLNAVLFCACLVVAGRALASEVPRTTVLINATVIDATGSDPIPNATVVIDGAKISSVSQDPFTG